MQALRTLLAYQKNIPEDKVKIRGAHHLLKRADTQAFILEFYSKTPEKFHKKKSDKFVVDWLLQALQVHLQSSTPPEGILKSDKPLRSAIKELLRQNRIPLLLSGF